MIEKLSVRRTEVARIILAASVLLFFPLFAAEAQVCVRHGYRQEVSFGLGGVPFLSIGGSNSTEFPTLDDRTGDSGGDLHDVYKTRFTNVRFVPVFSVDYRYNVTRNVSFGVSMSATRVWGKGYNVVFGTEAAKKNITAVYLIPQVRYSYYVYGPWLLYGNLGFGGGYFRGKEETERISRLVFVCESVPLGIRFGRRFFAGAELVVGMATYGGRGCVGWRF